MKKDNLWEKKELALAVKAVESQLFQDSANAVESVKNLTPPALAASPAAETKTSALGVAKIARKIRASASVKTVAARASVIAVQLVKKNIVSAVQSARSQTVASIV